MLSFRLHNKLFKKTLLTSLFFIIFFSGCTHKDVHIYEQEDERLTCEKLTKEISDVIDVNYDINSKTGLETRSVFTWILWPVLGAANQTNASIARDKVDERFYRLVKLKKINHCRFTDREFYFMRHKGRLSDNY
jgi:hypothetical protein